LAGERRDGHRLECPGRHYSHGVLMVARIVRRLIPDADISLTLTPFFILRAKAENRAALRADEILCRRTHRPAKTAGLPDDLVSGKNPSRAANLLNRLHLLDRLEQFHPDRGRPNTEIFREPVENRVPVIKILKFCHYCYSLYLWDIGAIHAPHPPFSSYQNPCQRPFSARFLRII